MRRNFIIISLKSIIVLLSENEMETENKDRKIGVFVYELLGTAFIMYAFMVSKGDCFASAIPTTIAMMCIAYNVSGGHFNPAISIGMFFANK